MSFQELLEKIKEKIQSISEQQWIAIGAIVLGLILIIISILIWP